MQIDTKTMYHLFRIYFRIIIKRIYFYDNYVNSGEKRKRFKQTFAKKFLGKM